MREKTDTSNGETKVTDLLKLENEKTKRWFIKTFYSLAPIPVFLIFELLIKREIMVSITTALIILCIMLSTVIYSKAIFKAYHNLLYYDESYCCKVEGIPEWKLVVSKLSISTVWFAIFGAVVLLILFMHSYLLDGMPSEIMKTEFISSAVEFVNENFGRGIYLSFSIFSIFLQAITLISIAYVAASASHMKFCVRYKALAGIFVFVAIYYFENDFATVIKKIVIKIWGGAENVMAHNATNTIEILMVVEAISYVLIIMLNIAVACYLLKRKYKEE